MNYDLSIRIDESNADHHLWNNHGVWWVHYTVLADGLWQRRVRRSLGTRDQVTARALRDQLFRDLAQCGTSHSCEGPTSDEARQRIA